MLLCVVVKPPCRNWPTRQPMGCIQVSQVSSAGNSCVLMAGLEKGLECSSDEARLVLVRAAELVLVPRPGQQSGNQPLLCSSAVGGVAIVGELYPAQHGAFEKELRGLYRKPCPSPTGNRNEQNWPYGGAGRADVLRLSCVLLCSYNRDFLPSRNAKQMPAAVAEALKSMFQLEGDLSPSEAEEYLTALERSHRFQMETWS